MSLKNPFAIPLPVTQLLYNFTHIYLGHFSPIKIATLSVFVLARTPVHIEYRRFNHGPMATSLIIGGCGNE